VLREDKQNKQNKQTSKHTNDGTTHCALFGSWTAGAFLASLPQMLYLLRCRRCFLRFVAAGVFFVCYVAAGAFFVSLSQVFSLCRRCRCFLYLFRLVL